MVGARSIGPVGLVLGLVVACSSTPAGSSGAVATTAGLGRAGPTSTAASPASAPTALASATDSPQATSKIAPPPPFGLGFPAFSNGGAMPPHYTCSGADVSPPVTWSHQPAATVAYALVVVDTDAGGFVHWVVADIPGDRTSLAAGERIGVAGRNSFGGVGYGGPCPPVGSGVHHYVFTLYSLSHRLGLGGVPTAAQVRAAAAKVTLATARLTATYLR